ncbi:2TM domain-containing protein [Robiginitalea sp. SC105]|uniref:2TM domain-containing protein n=1 Tax=Robiginitalea sp. SC105 TaxID=2762332 RepID=UPI00163A2328|nr:2TM domain-containing protein [Robiginitalea sp. SC105]MBC2839369.1 2TM domain-containing protein [Robiginitalea sp. SC105]
MEDFNKESKYLRAKERVQELKKFYGNAVAYVFVISLLAIVNYLTYWEYKWFLWAALGWGIGLFFHAIRTFDLNPFFSRDWEERKIREFMEDEERRPGKWE